MIVVAVHSVHIIPYDELNGVIIEVRGMKIGINCCRSEIVSGLDDMAGRACVVHMSMQICISTSGSWSGKFCTNVVTDSFFILPIRVVRHGIVVCSSREDLSGAVYWGRMVDYICYLIFRGGQSFAKMIYISVV